MRGWENLNKRFKLAAAIYNLSQLLRKIFGFGTPKQLAAARGRGPLVRFVFVLTLALATIRRVTFVGLSRRQVPVGFFHTGGKNDPFRYGLSSTGC